MGLFKSKEQRQMERRLKVRRVKKRLSTQVGKLRQQREKYMELGRQAAREEKPEKVRLLAKAVLQFKAMEKKFQDILLTLELFEAQSEMMGIQRQFVDAIKACSMSIRDTNMMKSLAAMEADFSQAVAASEEAQEQIDMFLETGPETILESQGNTAEAPELAALMQELRQGAREAEKAGAAPDAIDDDIATIQQHLKREV